MNKQGGWTGKILKVDLSEKKVFAEGVEPGLYKCFLGGRGFNIWTLYQNLTKEVHPFDPQNVLVFGAGPLVGTLTPANGRYNVSSRSPLTTLLGDANSAGLWAPTLKKAGYDGLVIRGAADQPVYLFITGERAEIRNAAHLWGMTVSETTRVLRQEHGDNARVLAIGPAGEHLVRFACIMNDVDRAAGRTGNGAVMGSKKLKAIVVAGQGRVAMADPERARAVAKEINSIMLLRPRVSKARPQFGTTMCTLLYNQMGVLPTRNHRRGFLPGPQKSAANGWEGKIRDPPKGLLLLPHPTASRYARSGRGNSPAPAWKGPNSKPWWPWGPISAAMVWSRSST